MAERLRLYVGSQESFDEIDLDVLYEDIADSEEFNLIKQIVLEQKTIRELAEDRKISINACKKRVERARRRLKILLSHNY